MKKSKLVRPTPALLLFAGVIMSAGCGGAPSCEGGQRHLPARWVEAKLPLVEGGSVCSYGEDRNALITYNGVEPFELRDKYEQQLKADGWKFTLPTPDRTFIAAEKDGTEFTFGFRDCERPLSTCSHVNVSTTSRPR
jgi:hypothetical protein